jgi:capsular polysaccharide biosynthesis protein
METLDVYRALWRHKLFILVLTALLALGAWFFVSRQTKTYQATSLVRVQQKITNPTEAYGALQTGQLLAETYAKIVEADSVRTRIFANLRDQIPADDGTIKIDAKPVNQLDLLNISAQSPDPADAALVANAAPKALRQFIRQTGTLRDQIVSVDQATIPSKPVAPHVKRSVALAILLGLIFNSALALVLELLGDRVRDPVELEGLFGLPVLATVPSVKLKVGGGENRSGPTASVKGNGRSRTLRRAESSGNVS